MRSLAWICVLLFPAFAFAQQEEAVFNEKKDTTIYRFGFTGTGNVNKTRANGTSYIFNNSTRFSVDKRILTVNAYANWIYGENTSTKTNHDFLATLDADLFKHTRKLYYWALATYEKSFSLKIDDRFQVGAGLGYTLVNSNQLNLVVTDGLLYEKTDLRETDKYGRNNYKTVRNSFRLKNRLKISELITVDGVHFLQHSLSDSEDYIIRTTNTVNFKIKKWLSFTVGLTYNKLNFTKSENLLFNYGITIENTF